MIARIQELLLTVVTANPLLERLAAASIDLIVVNVAVAAIVALTRIRSQRVVALLWLVALTKPILSLAVGTPAPLIPIATPAVVETAVVDAPAREYEFAFTTNEDGVVMQQEERVVVSNMDEPAVSGAGIGGVSGGMIVAGAWILGLLAMLGVSVVDRLRVRRVVTSATPAGDDIMEAFARVASTFRGERRPAVRVTRELESPALAGTFRPVILVPEWMTAPEHGERLEWALRHELTHWSARDHLANFVAEVLRALLFFHPLAWWTTRRWKEAMEMACDEAVVASRRDVKRYAEQLYQILAHVDERKRLALSASLFASRTQIGRRIEMLLRTQRRVARPGAVALSLTAVFAVASFAFGADFSPRPPKAPEAPVTAAAPVLADVYAQTGDKTAHYDNANVHEVDDDGNETRLRAKGIEFERGTGRVLHLDDDGYLRVWERLGDTERRVHVTSDSDGGLRYIYLVNNERSDWDDDARAWLSRVLREHLTRVRNHDRLIMAPPPGAPSVAGTAPISTPEPAIAPTPEPRPVPAPDPTPAPR